MVQHDLFFQVESNVLFVLDVAQASLEKDTYVNIHDLSKSGEHYSLHISGQRHHKMARGKGISSAIKMCRNVIPTAPRQIFGKIWGRSLLYSGYFPEGPHIPGMQVVAIENVDRAVGLIGFQAPSKTSRNAIVEKFREMNPDDQIIKVVIWDDIFPQISIVVFDGSQQCDRLHFIDVYSGLDDPFSTSSNVYVGVPGSEFQIDPRQFNKNL